MGGIIYRLYAVRCARCATGHTAETHSVLAFADALEEAGWEQVYHRWHCPTCRPHKEGRRT